MSAVGGKIRARSKGTYVGDQASVNDLGDHAEARKGKGRCNASRTARKLRSNCGPQSASFNKLGNMRVKN